MKPITSGTWAILRRRRGTPTVGHLYIDHYGRRLIGTPHEREWHSTKSACGQHRLLDETHAHLDGPSLGIDITELFKWRSESIWCKECLEIAANIKEDSNTQQSPSNDLQH